MLLNQREKTYRELVKAKRGGNQAHEKTVNSWNERKMVYRLGNSTRVAEEKPEKKKENASRRGKRKRPHPSMDMIIDTVAFKQKTISERKMWRREGIRRKKRTRKSRASPTNRKGMGANKKKSGHKKGEKGRQGKGGDKHNNQRRNLGTKRP